MIQVILWDIDGTLLDFPAAERAALRACFAGRAFPPCTEAMLARYSEINQDYWRRLERGEISKREVLLGRFLDFFAWAGLPPEQAESFNREFQLRLGDTIVFLDRGYELVRELKAAGYRQYAVTNGTRLAQRKKLALSGLEALLDGIFISEELGFEKPMKGFFDAVLAAIGPRPPREILLVGDSLTSDMRGGIGAGLPCCWYNPRRLENADALPLDYEIRNLWELKGLLARQGGSGMA